MIKCKGDDEPINDIEEKFEFYKDFIGSNFNEDFDNAPPSELSCQNEDIFLVMWSSGTTGIPKGIQLDMKAAKTWLTWFKIKFIAVTTLCKFHIGGFFAPLGLTNANSTIVFNHGPDLESDGDASEILYQEVDKFKPSLLLFGSHNLVEMSKQPPKDKLLDLSSVLFAMPAGSTVPDSLYSNLKTSLSNLVSVAHPYGMTELAGKALNHNIQKSKNMNRAKHVSIFLIHMFQ